MRVYTWKWKESLHILVAIWQQKVRLVSIEIAQAYRPIVYKFKHIDKFSKRKVSLLCRDFEPVSCALRVWVWKISYLWEVHDRYLQLGFVDEDVRLKCGRRRWQRPGHWNCMQSLKNHMRKTLILGQKCREWVELFKYESGWVTS